MKFSFTTFVLFSLLFAFSACGDNEDEVEISFPQTYLSTNLEHGTLVPYRVVSETEVELIESFPELAEIDAEIEEEIFGLDFNPDTIAYQLEIIDEARAVLAVTQGGFTESDTLTYLRTEDKVTVDLDGESFIFFIDEDDTNQGRVCVSTAIFTYFSPILERRTGYFSTNFIDCDQTSNAENHAIFRINEENNQFNANIQAGDTVLVKPSALIFTLQN